MGLEKIVKSIDIFGEPISFEIDGRSSSRSYLGALLSLVTTVITFSYAVSRFIKMREFGDTVHQ